MPTLLVEPASSTENSDLQFVFTLSEPALAEVTVRARTISGTALEGSDISSIDTIVTIPAGATTATLNISPSTFISGEIDENFTLEVYDPVNATLAGGLPKLVANGTILEGLGTSLFVVPTFAFENSGEAVFAIHLSKPLANDVNFGFATSDGSAVAGLDYENTSGVVTFLAGQTEAAVRVPLFRDSVNEADETFSLTLTPTLEIVNGSDGATAIGTIVEGGPVTSTSPVAIADTGVDFTTDEDTSFTTGNVLANDTDVDGDVLSVSGLDTTGTLGLVTDNGDGTFDYDPNGAFESLGVGDSATDTFTYDISDGNGGTDTATVSITVTGVNDAPVAANDIASTGEDTAVDIDVLANDSDVEGDTLTVDSVGSGTNGTTAINTDGTVRYTPNAGFSGTDEFTYTISDGNNGADTATVSVTVDPVGPTLNPVIGTEASDYLVGTNTADAIRGLGGRYDRLRGGEDADQFIFGAETDNGIRERDLILDYEVGLDSIILEQALVTSVRAISGGAVIFLDGDRDAIYVRGENVTADNLTIIEEDGFNFL